MGIGSLTSMNLRYGMGGLGTLGLGAYGAYGGYGANGGYAAMNKSYMENNYDVWQSRVGYSNKPGVETMTINDQCQNIGTLLSKGRTDDASKQIEKLVKTLKSYPQYETYNTREIRSVIRSLYQNATGSDLLNDIEMNASGSVTQGLKEGLVLGGIFANKATKADLEEQVTGMNKGKGETFGEIAGAMISGAASYGGIATISKNPVVIAIGAAIGAGVGLIKAIMPSTIKVK